MSRTIEKHRFSRFAQIIVAIVAVMLTVGPLGLLQVVAWTGMAVNYGSHYGVIEGLGRTFDGQHPCVLCKEITKTAASEKENKASATVVEIKLVGVIVPIVQSPTLDFPKETFVYFSMVNFFAGRTDRPASPPPRILAA